jgi:hypothetical protein
MTDEPEAEESNPRLLSEPKPCAQPGCENVVPAGSHIATKFCEEHRGRTARKHRARGDAPPQIAVQIGGGATKTTKARGGAKAEELAAVEERALQIVQIAAAFVMVATKPPHNEADAADIAKGAPAVAAATKELAVYEPWVRKLAAGGEVSGRVTAWLGFVFALSTVASPILVRHEVIKGSMAEIASTILANGQSLVTADADAA